MTGISLKWSIWNAKNSELYAFCKSETEIEIKTTHKIM